MGFTWEGEEGGGGKEEEEEEEKERKGSTSGGKRRAVRSEGEEEEVSDLLLKTSQQYSLGVAVCQPFPRIRHNLNFSRLQNQRTVYQYLLEKKDVVQLYSPFVENSSQRTPQIRSLCHP